MTNSFIADSIASDDGEYLPIYLDNSDHLGRPVLPSFWLFLKKHSIYACCGKPCPGFFEKCNCGIESDYAEREDGIVLKVSHKEMKELNKNLRNSSQALQGKIRQKRMKSNGGKHTKKQIGDLLKIQKSICYYCGESLIVNNQEKFHKDHKEPIDLGGSNGIENIVLSCYKCNQDKSNQSPEYFLRKISKSIKPENKPILRKIRLAVKKFIKQVTIDN